MPLSLISVWFLIPQCPSTSLHHDHQESCCHTAALRAFSPDSVEDLLGHSLENEVRGFRAITPFLRLFACVRYAEPCCLGVVESHVTQAAHHC